MQNKFSPQEIEWLMDEFRRKESERKKNELEARQVWNRVKPTIPLIYGRRCPQQYRLECALRDIVRIAFDKSAITGLKSSQEQEVIEFVSQLSEIVKTKYERHRLTTKSTIAL